MMQGDSQLEDDASFIPVEGGLLSGGGASSPSVEPVVAAEVRQG